ncbi:MAG: FAA hydrolase family protein, partial [Burkholderiaceae bacterium]|nr:FAA hydrolase family protein [Burkholderiaceae bacterium]
MDYCVSPPVVKSLPVKNQKARFPVNRIFCVGRNYAAHAIEMGKDP